MPKKSNKTIEDRSKYVKEYVSNYKNKGTAIKRIAKQLFVSEKTIERDLKR